MNFSFSNPLGLWALLGLPAVVVIHLLQRRSRRQVVTTLFLLQQMRRESETGSRIERLRTSPPFWMQLLMVLLLTWLLAQPRWLKNDAVQRIAVVLDSSASMQAFREPALLAVRDVLGALTSPTTRAELTLLTSDTEAASLYHGGSALELMKAAATWEPLLGVHDFTPALRTARSLTGLKGVVILVTDHALTEKPPFDAHLVSVGEKTANAGFAGMSVEEKDGQWFWRAMVRNYSDVTLERTWLAKADGAKSEPKKLVLRAGETQTLSGPFPPGDVTLELSPDAFTLDDTLPMMRPMPKILAVKAELPWLAELMERFAHVQMVKGPAQADVAALETNGDSMPPATQHACVFLPSPAALAGNLVYLKGNIVAETHPLVAGLSWQGLLARETPPLPRTPEDRVLLWQGERPLIALRQTKSGARQLLCHFDTGTSNALRLPALAVLLHRFLESVREEKLAP
ncbi:MAG: VWA domain-containing protein, partial [Verrucomicrobiaceae bacterium]|nr:VWA domain-containing protein [Verrucomicrobiaceae bacterium]